MLRTALISFAVVVGAVAISRGDAAQQATATLGLRVTGVGGGVTARPSGVLTSCSGSTCYFRFEAGTSVTLTATGSQRARFARWLGACTHSQTTCTFSMSGSRSVTARFSPVRLYIDRSQGGSISFSPAAIPCGPGCGEFNYGTEVTLTAQGCCGYQFDLWSSPCAGSRSNPCRFRIFDSTTASARFINCDGGECTAAIAQPLSRTVYALIEVKGAGRVSANGNECRNSGGTRNCRFAFSRGDSIAVRAYGTTFKSWGGLCRGSIPRCQFAAFKDPNGYPPKVSATFNP
jgi:List-Bact-rpt repeat protein